MNEINSLVNAIIIAHQERRRVVLCEDFGKDYSKALSCPLGEVIDLEHLDTLTAPLDVVVYDTTVTIAVVRAIYGTYQQYVDVTEDVRARFAKNGYLHIPAGFDLNRIKGDPHHGKVKQLFVTYEVAGTPYRCVYSEHSQEEIRLGWGQLYRDVVINSVNELEIDLYHQLIRDLRFTAPYYEYAQRFVDTLDSNRPLSVIHVRNEDDAIKFWSNINHMTPTDFEEALTAKYVGLIRTYVNIDDNLVVLTSRTSSPVIAFLEASGYHYRIGQKDLVEGRECNAIVDLLIGQHCTATFIGSVNPHNRHGSTFSYMLWKRMADTVQSVLIDLDEIHHPEYLKPEPAQQ